MRGLGSFIHDAWRLARPYYGSEERWTARGMLLAIIVLNLSMVGMSVVLSFWNRQFYNALQEKDWHAFVQLLFFYRRTGSSIMPGFCEVAVVYILVAVYRTYLNQWLQIRWRRWLTGRFLDEWLADRAYYRISLTTDRAAIGTDNPDQRIAEDLRDFVENTLSLGIGLLSNVVSLLSFVGILWGLSGAIKVLGVTVPGYMVWVAVVYAVLGTWLTHLVGRPLVQLFFRQQRVEADFRYALVRVRENIEGVALYSGEEEEKGNLAHRFANLVGNWWAIMRRTKVLNALTSGYDQIAVVFPVIVAAPRYFSGQIQLGGLTQTAGAFGRVQEALSWFVSFYSSLASWRATVERLTTFHRAIVIARAAAAEGLAIREHEGSAVMLQQVTLALPDGSKLIEDTDVAFRRGESVVVTGRSGSGKSTLFRAIAGIWPFATGRVLRPAGRCLFLPQRPYIPLGTLRHVVTYPAPADAYTIEAIAQAMTDVGLGDLVARLDRDENWPQRLSGGEQQRIAIARALLTRPDWLFLDEATASLDPDSEAEVYRAVKRRLPNTTIVSIAHHPTAAGLHDRRLVLKREGERPGMLLPGDPAPAAAE
jgi:vitamin B12/bleomycin/antimicrobial peptide transport system ATP-binding/permease protein